jgi:hypothetical protein
MNLKYLYLSLCILSLVLTYSQVPAITKQYGYNFLPMFGEQFSTPSLRFLGFDLIIAALASTIFILAEGIRLKIKSLYIPVLAVFLIGISFALPLFLFLRENKIQKDKQQI